MATRHREEDEGGESYFASVSDLMVGILFIFLLMLTVFALNFADDNKDEIIKQLQQQVIAANRERDAANAALTEARAQLARQTAEIQQLERDIDALRRKLDDATQREVQRDKQLAALVALVSQTEAEVSTESRRMQEIRSRLLAQIQTDLGEKGISVEISKQQDVLRLPSNEVFQIGTSLFTPKGREQTTILLQEMANLLPCYAAAAPSDCINPVPIFETILIEGHTDTLPADNWRLSTERALAVRNLMTGPLSGLSDLRNAAGLPLLGMAGYGDSRPLPSIPGVDPRNRRIEVRFLLSASREAELASLRASLGQLRQRLEALRAHE
ncbi:MAG: hypothetical protein BGP12_12400 [Rhodospirillales bacterium 70-18]|nr:MAG: hypothetical protein BGP12_12400 [Rhodospirillales bacterium 70-18]